MRAFFDIFAEGLVCLLLDKAHFACESKNSYSTFFVIEELNFSFATVALLYLNVHFPLFSRIFGIPPPRKQHMGRIPKIDKVFKSSLGQSLIYNLWGAMLGKV